MPFRTELKLHVMHGYVMVIEKRLCYGFGHGVNKMLSISILKRITPEWINKKRIFLPRNKKKINRTSDKYIQK